jgi:hypothetical protein
MFSAKRRVWMLSGAVALATIFMLPVSAASASTVRPMLAASVSPTAVRPLSASECNPNPLLAGSECTVVTGTGTYVDTIGGQFFSQTTVELYKLHIQIYGPGGTIKNCDTFNLEPLGVSDVCLWTNPHPHVHVTQGNYCSRTWELLNGKSFVVSAECIDVKS